ncbi:glycerophosphodiester phosphodiesterase family protein [Mucilaginibacter panaciglaebae]|uniref:Glycerophosphodiester phosphodiesterase family protein n=1 Tax=Mucilaginibacter panaciglaebae TaxID=502331 RepID=A0ABP7WC20_9SPHI
MNKNFNRAICGTVCLMGTLALSCNSLKPASYKKSYPTFFKVGHRGTRGLMPENTIPAMEKGIEVGANMVEMDVHITKDGQVIVYHDESFDPTYTLMPNGSDIPVKERTRYTFYQMNYADIKPFIIGTKAYPAYPQQQSLKTYTPLLGELIDSVDAYTQAKGLPGVYYLVEIKSAEKTDGFDQPAPAEYMKKVMNVLKPKKLGKRLIIQSFDMRPLQVLHSEYPEIALGYLTSDKTLSVAGDISKLGFAPMFYNPYGKLITAEMVKQCHEKGMLIAPWTINTVAEMRHFKSIGVDGIITDYPNLFKELQ